jgi:hypothetical protein
MQAIVSRFIGFLFVVCRDGGSDGASAVKYLGEEVLTALVGHSPVPYRPFRRLGLRTMMSTEDRRRLLLTEFNVPSTAAPP